MGDVLRMQVPHLHGSNANLVLLIAGANDLRTTAHPQTILRRFRHLLDAVHEAAPNAHLVAAGMPDVTQTIGVPALMKPLISRLCGTLNEGMRRIADEYGDEFIDLFSFTNRPLRSDFIYLCGDGYHPCDGGYEELAERSVPAIERVLARYSSSTSSTRSESISS
jgi:lysophospholipase L1-like esterase